MSHFSSFFFIDIFLTKVLENYKILQRLSAIKKKAKIVPGFYWNTGVSFSSLALSLISPCPLWPLAGVRLQNNNLQLVFILSEEVAGINLLSRVGDAYHSLGGFHQRSHTGYIRASHWQSDPLDSVTVHNTVNISKKKCKSMLLFCTIDLTCLTRLWVAAQLPLMVLNMKSQMGTEADACSLHKSQIKGWLERNLKLARAQGNTH